MQMVCSKARKILGLLNRRFYNVLASTLLCLMMVYTCSLDWLRFTFTRSV